jgi:hypothetical protein
VFDILKNLDRRWIFLLMFVAVAVPVYFQLEFPEKPTKMVNDVFDAIEDLPEGSNVLMAWDYDPASEGELQPMASALTRHCAKKKHKLYFITLWPQGPPMIGRSIKILNSEFPEYEYGVNYVNLGYRPGLEGVISLIVTDLKKLYSNDVGGRNLNDIPMTKDLKNIRSMRLIINVSAGTPGVKEWVQYAATRYKIKIVAGTTGVGAPVLYPYYPNQLAGMLGAIKGAAEYEKAIMHSYPEYENNPEAQEGLRRMGPQLVAHLLMIGLIILGNVIFFVEKSRGSAQ